MGHPAVVKALFLVDSAWFIRQNSDAPEAFSMQSILEARPSPEQNFFTIKVGRWLSAGWPAQLLTR
jgi:hypothetical protein